MEITIIEIDYHRNGVGGNGFYPILFISNDEDTMKHVMLGIVFDEPGDVAVLDMELLSQHDIKFMSNSWRGDKFEPELRKAIEKFRESW